MFKHYLTSAWRHLLQHKLTTSINVLCLVIGLVCFLASYSMVTLLSSGDRHYPNADRTYMIRWAMNDSLSASAGPWLTGKHLRADMPEIETVARATIDVGIQNEMPVTTGERKSFVRIAYADAAFLDIFALPFLAGDSKNALRSPRSAVLSKATAVKFFDTPAAALGRTLRFQDGSEVTIRGVVDELKQPSHLSTSGGASIGQMRFELLASMDVLEAAPTYKPIISNWNTPLFLTYVLLPTDGSFTADELRQRLSTFGERYANANGNIFRFDAIRLSDYWISNIGVFSGSAQSGSAGAWMFYFLGAVVLLISCLNYANLATAQGATRAKEIGMRRVVGARRSQVAIQFLCEAGILAGMALAGAIVIATMVIAAVGQPAFTSVVLSTLTTSHFWITLIALLLAVTIAAGFYPAFVLSNVRPIQAVRAGRVRSGGKIMTRVLVGLQFAGASFLMIAMIVMTTQYRTLKKMTLNENNTTLVTIGNNIRDAGVSFETLRSDLLQQRHVKSVTASSVSPWLLIGGTSMVKSSNDATAAKIPVMINRVHHDFFATLGTSVLAGRVFDRDHASDLWQRSATANPPSIVVDRAFAEQRGWVPLTAALGKTLYRIDGDNPNAVPEPRMVIGVVETQPMSILSPFGATASVYALTPDQAVLPIIRISTNDISAALNEIESSWNRLAPTVALKVELADKILSDNHRMFAITAAVFGGVSSLALVISLLGLIGMSIDVISRRRHEIGVRKTLGASVQSIVQLLLTDFSKPVIVANLLVWPLAFITMQAYLSIFTQRMNLSVVPFVVSLTLTMLVSWVAVAAQATRAARLNPATVLRYE